MGAHASAGKGRSGKCYEEARYGSCSFLIIPAAANARNTLPCFRVDYENNPLVILTGRITKHHHKLSKDSELRAAEGFFLKLDSPLRADASGDSWDSGDCYNWDEIAISGTSDMERWNNRHVIIEGKLNRFGSALVYPAIFIESSTIKR